MPIAKWLFSGVFSVAQNVAVLLGIAALFTMGAPVSVVTFDFLTVMLVVMAATLLQLHKAARLAAKGVAEGIANGSMPRNYTGQLPLVMQMLILHNVGTASMCFIVLFYRSTDVFTHALAAGCIAALLLSAAESLYCLIGKKGHLKQV